MRKGKSKKNRTSKKECTHLEALLPRLITQIIHHLRRSIQLEHRMVNHLRNSLRTICRRQRRNLAWRALDIQAFMYRSNQSSPLGVCIAHRHDGRLGERVVIAVAVLVAAMRGWSGPPLLAALSATIGAPPLGRASWPAVVAGAGTRAVVLAFAAFGSCCSGSLVCLGFFLLVDMFMFL